MDSFYNSMNYGLTLNAAPDQIQKIGRTKSLDQIRTQQENDSEKLTNPKLEELYESFNIENKDVQRRPIQIYNPNSDAEESNIKYQSDLEI